MSNPKETSAEWWYCLDEECLCSYPRIMERGLPGVASSDGGIRYAYGKELEAGPWESQPDIAERRGQWEWLLNAARRHKVINLAEIEDEATIYLDLS